MESFTGGPWHDSAAESPGARQCRHESLAAEVEPFGIRTTLVHTSLEFLLEHLPPGLHLVLASRSDPPLPRLRAVGA